MLLNLASRARGSRTLASVLATLLTVGAASAVSGAPARPDSEADVGARTHPAARDAGQDAHEEARGEAESAEVAAARAAEAARLKSEFDKALIDLRQAVAAFQVELTRLQHSGVPREDWPPYPSIRFFARFEELALRDQPDALRWCLTTLGSIGLTPAEVAEKKSEYYARLVIAHADLPWMVDLVEWVRADGTAAGIGFERADELLQALAERTTMRATRGAALAGRSTLYANRQDDASRAVYEKLVRELVEKYADLPTSADAHGRLFQLEHLTPGKSPPDVEAVDTEGRTLRLSEYRGRILVLDFWGYWCSACVRGLPEVRRLVQAHAEDPFTFVGIATDVDLEYFRARARADNVTWRNAWAGGTDGSWPKAWGIQRYPSLYVLDEKGVVRFVDVRGDALERAVRTLLDEMRARENPKPR